VDGGVFPPGAGEGALLVAAPVDAGAEGARGQAVQEGGQRLVARGRRYRAVEGEVVGEDLLRVVGRLHRRHMAPDLRQLFRGDPGGGQRGRRRLQDAAHLQQFGEPWAAGQIGHDAERLQQVAGPELSDVDAGAVPGLQHAEDGERADRLPHRAAGQAEPYREVPLGGQPLAGLQQAVGDHRLDPFDGVLSDRAPAGGGPPGRGLVHVASPVGASPQCSGRSGPTITSVGESFPACGVSPGPSGLISMRQSPRRPRKGQQ
jgi:hypothetical protein